MSLDKRTQKGSQRRRKSGINISGKRLPVDLTQCDFEKFAYRWINDDEVRLFAFTQQDDWDFVPKDGAERDNGADLGNAKSQVIGTREDGSPKRAYLCRKPKQYYDEDQKEKQIELNRQLEQMRRGNARDGSSQGDYVGPISIT